MWLSGIQLPEHQPYSDTDLSQHTEQPRSSRVRPCMYSATPQLAIMQLCLPFRQKAKPITQENVTSLNPLQFLQGFERQIWFLWESLLQLIGVEVKKEDGAVRGFVLDQIIFLLVLIS